VYGKTKNNASLKTHPKTGQAVDPKIRFQGQWEDLETGLYQNLHRFYDPHCGRYINHDPIGLMGGLNQYQYCPNPVGWVDPLGLSCKEADGGYATRKKLRTEVYNAQRPTTGRHASKHINAMTHDQAIEYSLGRGTLDGRPEASYFPELNNNIGNLEKEAAYAAIREGQVFDHGGVRFMFYKFDQNVGYNQGKATSWVRVEITKTGTPVIHSHPVDPGYVRKYIPNAEQH
jgi:RHS repeat-associated protein